MMNDVPRKKRLRHSMTTYFTNNKLRENKDLNIIFEHFLKPLIQQVFNSENDHAAQRALGLIFHEGYRHIYTATALKDFRMPGLFKLAASRHIKKFSFKVKKGTRLYIRVDENHPDEIDIEVVQKMPGVKNIPNFRLTKSQYDSILSRIDIRKPKLKKD